MSHSENNLRLRKFFDESAKGLPSPSNKREFFYSEEKIKSILYFDSDDDLCDVFLATLIKLEDEEYLEVHDFSDDILTYKVLVNNLK